MSQRDILKLLEEKKDQWLTTVDIYSMIPIGKASLSCNVKKLRQYKLVDSYQSINDTRQPVFYYKHKPVKED